MTDDSIKPNAAKPNGKNKAGIKIHPLSPLLYLKRNPGKTAPIGLIILLSVMLVACIVGLLDSIGDTIRTIYGYNKYFAAAIPRGSFYFDEQIKAKIKKAPEFGAMVDVHTSFITVKTIVGKIPFPVFGLKSGDLEAMVERTGLTLSKGRFPQQGKPEMIMSEVIANNLNVKIGDVIMSKDTEDSWATQPIKLVGTLKGDSWFAVAPYDAISHPLGIPITAMFIISKDVSLQAKLDDWLSKNIEKDKARLWINKELVNETNDAFKTLYLIVNICVLFLAIVISIMMGLLANIYFTQRMTEFGLLQAIGFTRNQLLLRVASETILVVIVGWISGLVTAYGVLQLADALLAVPRGLVLNPANLHAYQSTLTIPACIICFAFLTIWWRLRTFDPVAIVERRLV